jgi:hypothetical protein
MTPSATQCIPAQFNLGTLKGRDVITNFAGRITSDAGIVLMAVGQETQNYSSLR